MRSLRSLLGLTPTPDSFAQELLDSARHAGHDQWRYDASEQALIDGRDPAQRVHLPNLFLEYRRAPRAARAGLRAKYRDLLTQNRDVPTLWTLAAPQLYPALRSRYAMTTVEIDHRDSAKPFPPQVRQPWVEDVVKVLLLDHGSSMTAVPEHTAEVWGVSREALWARALANLRALPRPQWNALDHGVYQIQSAVAYEESFVLVDEVMNALPFAERSVITLPNRGILLAADSSDLAAVGALITLSRQHLENSPWPLSGTLVARAPSGWSRYAVPDTLAPAAHSLSLMNWAQTYHDQKAGLEALHERTHTDVFVATLRCGPIRPRPSSFDPGARCRRASRRCCRRRITSFSTRNPARRNRN